MSRIKADKYWFLVEVSEGAWFKHLVYANSAAEANKFLGPVSENFRVEQLTWRRLSELTGCMVAGDKDMETFALGYPLFRRKGICFCMYTVED